LAQEPNWKQFKSRGGWKISYPADWQISSCRSCKDPTSAGVFVDFSPPTNAEGFVMVEQLASRPSNISADAWLRDVSTRANVNPQIQGQKLTVSSVPARKVRYRTVSGEEMESVYVVSGSDTFALDFNGELDSKRPGVPLEKLNGYAIYLEMITTFRVELH